MALAAVALGSNLGDREALVHAAVSDLRRLLSGLRVSRTFETEPVGIVGPRSPFLNAAAVGRTGLDPHALLAALLGIERAHGRERPHPGASRTLDLDLIFVDDRRLDSPDLVLPHPRFRERRFVLEPLAEVAPDWRDPVTGLTVRELLARLPAR